MELFIRRSIVDTLREWGGRGWRTGLNTLSGFEKFILRGNVVDLAVGVIIGAAFNSVVQGLVNDLISPLIGLLGIHNFPGLAYTVNGNVFRLGNFVNVVISFLITAAVVYFFVVKPVTAFQDRIQNLRPKKEEPPATRDCPFCLSTVNIKATRCAFCTAQLPPADQPAAIETP
jgi:large conductance mechanosensitive channel